ncbi:MAG: S26 family signal peptidase, partial [Proteobacteria bacterium]|nr:S26 family signal peptidase [Pseudomonadota bacterium]
MVKKRLIPLPIVCLTLCLSGLVALFWAFDLIFNYTPSMPRGIWRVSKGIKQGEILRHKVVLFCPADTEFFRWARSQGILRPGRCPGDYTPLLKEVLGLPGDLIEFREGHVFINGRQLPRSKILKSFSRRVFNDKESIPIGYVWVM